MQICKQETRGRHTEENSCVQLIRGQVVVWILQVVKKNLGWAQRWYTFFPLIYYKQNLGILSQL